MTIRIEISDLGSESPDALAALGQALLLLSEVANAQPAKPRTIGQMVDDAVRRQKRTLADAVLAARELGADQGNPEVQVLEEALHATPPQPDPATVFGGTTVTADPAGTPSAAAVFGGAVQALAPVSATLPPLPPAPPGPAATGAPAVDSTGLPWDARIHSGAKTQTAAGAWTKRRGVDPQVVLRVEAEWRALPPAAQPVYQFQPDAAPPVSEAPLTPPPAASPVPVPPPPAAAAPADFPGFVQAVSAEMGAGRRTQAHLRGALAANGVAQLPMLAAAPHLIAATWATFMGA